MRLPVPPSGRGALRIRASWGGVNRRARFPSGFRSAQCAHTLIGLGCVPFKKRKKFQRIIEDCIRAAFFQLLSTSKSPVDADSSHSGIAGRQHVHIAVPDKGRFVWGNAKMPGRIEGPGGIGLFGHSCRPCAPPVFQTPQAQADPLPLRAVRGGRAYTGRCRRTGDTRQRDVAGNRLNAARHWRHWQDRRACSVMSRRDQRWRRDSLACP